MIPENRVNQFHPGQVWRSSRGYLWSVENIVNGQAVLRQGVNPGGRIKRRSWDAVAGWVLHSDPMYPAHNGGEG